LLSRVTNEAKSRITKGVHTVPEIEHNSADKTSIANAQIEQGLRKYSDRALYRLGRSLDSFIRSRAMKLLEEQGLVEVVFEKVDESMKQHELQRFSHHGHDPRRHAHDREQKENEQLQVRLFARPLSESHENKETHPHDMAKALSEDSWIRSEERTWALLVPDFSKYLQAQLLKQSVDADAALEELEEEDAEADYDVEDDLAPDQVEYSYHVMAIDKSVSSHHASAMDRQHAIQPTERPSPTNIGEACTIA